MIQKSDIRWKQRLQNFEKALEQLKSAVDIGKQRDYSDLETQGLIQTFKFTHTEQLPDATKNSFEYYVNLLFYKSKKYRLVWLLEEDQIYIGIVTAYRDERNQ